MFFFKKKENENNVVNIEKIMEVENLPIYSRRPSPSFYFPRTSKANAEILLSIVQESVSEINRTCIPSAFFENWNMIFYTLKKLIILERQVKFRGTLPHALLERYKVQYEASVHEFLDRYADYRWKEEISPLKTERGKLNRNNKFLEPLLPHWGDMTEASQIRAFELKEVEKSLILSNGKR